MCTHVPPKACIRWVLVTMVPTTAKWMQPKCPSSGWRNTHECNTTSLQQWQWNNCNQLHRKDKSLKHCMCERRQTWKRKYCITPFIQMTKAGCQKSVFGGGGVTEKEVQNYLCVHVWGQSQFTNCCLRAPAFCDLEKTQLGRNSPMASES